MIDDLNKIIRACTPFGIRSVIRNIKQAAKNKYYTDRTIFETDIDKAIELLINSKDESLLIFDKVTEQKKIMKKDLVFLMNKEIDLRIERDSALEEIHMLEYHAELRGRNFYKGEQNK